MFFAVFFQVAPLLAGKVCVCTQNPFFHNFLGSASCKWVYPSLWGFITIVVAIFCNHSCAPRNTMWFTTTPWTSPMRSATPWAWESCLARRHTQKNARDCRKCVSWSGNTWWLIPLSKWLITPVINGISRVNPLITGVITHLLSGMSHQVSLESWISYPLVMTNIAMV